MEPFYLDMTLTVSSGFGVELGRIDMVIWLAANTYFAKKEAKGMLLKRSPFEENWTARDFQIPMAEAEQVARRLRALGFPERRPDVHETFDTAEIWQHFVFSAARDGAGRNTFELHLLPAGFEGEDAAAVHELFRHVLALTGVAREDYYFGVG